MGGSKDALLEPQVAATLRTLVAHAARMAGAERARLLVRDPGDPRVLVVLAAAGEPAGAVVAADEGLAGRCLAAGEPATGRIEGRTCVPVLSDGGVAGVLEADSQAVDDLAEMAEVIAAVLDQADAGRRLGRTLHAGIEALASLLDLRDGYAGRAAGEVADLACAVGERLGLGPAALAELGMAGRVHDIGKIGVPDRILAKPGRLDPDERAVMERHTVWGAETVGRIPGLEATAEIVRSHHERWDGRGYPAGLVGEEIPVSGRIIGACEAYRALTTDRPYRGAIEPDRAIALLEQGAGSHFDPAVVAALVAVLGERGVAAAGDATPPAAGRPRGTAPMPPPRTAHQRHALPAALERLEGLPALAESRDRLLAALDGTHASPTAIAEAVESDVALVIAILRLANRTRPGAIADVAEAVDALSGEVVEQLATGIAVSDFFERASAWPIAPEPFRAHAVAVQRATDLVARSVGYHDDGGGLLVAALLHDIGALVLAHAYPGYPEAIHGAARTPDERVRAERQRLGVDHALVGGVLLRRWRLPDELARAVERHHSDDAEAPAAILRLADMLAHHVHGHPVDPKRLLEAARNAGLDPAQLRGVMFELPASGMARRRPAERCPLTEKELLALRGLAEGKVYKDIADDLGIATSTVRSHLHKTYKKVGAVDRAQAVLIAAERGWL